MKSGVLIVIPAWNEAPNLEPVIGELRAARPADDIVVVDDGSTDATAEIARRLGCGPLILALHLGYGAAVQTGIKYGLRRGYRVVITFDGDGQHDPAEVEPLVAALDQGADFALGSRLLSEGSYRGSLLRRAGRRLFSTLTQVFTGLPLTDPTSGFKALGPRAQALFAQAGFPDRFPDADALVLARRARLVVVERPSHMRPSFNRHSMHGGLHAIGYTLNMMMSLLVAAMGRDADLHGNE